MRGKFVEFGKLTDCNQHFVLMKHTKVLANWSVNYSCKMREKNMWQKYQTTPGSGVRRIGQGTNTVCLFIYCRFEENT